MKLTGAAILVSRGMKVLQAAPAAYPYRSKTETVSATKRGEGLARPNVLPCVVEPVELDLSPPSHDIELWGDAAGRR
jgi:hypothetical protein